MTTLRWIDPNQLGEVERFELLRGHGWLEPELHRVIENAVPNSEGIYSTELGGLRKYGTPAHFWLRSCSGTTCSSLSNERIITLPEPDGNLLLLLGCVLLLLLKLVWRRPLARATPPRGNISDSKRNAHR